MPFQFTCQFCSTPFQRINRLRSGRVPHRYCSKACTDAVRRKASIDGFVSRFWNNVDLSGECWLWTASAAVTGYGILKRAASRDRLLAHRVAWEIATGEPVQDGYQVLHTCDVRLCVRTDDVGVYSVNGVAFPRRGHLWLGTMADNMRDMHVKSRSVFDMYPGKRPRGNVHGNALLTSEQVNEIRRRYAGGSLMQTDLARQYGVTNGAIWRIVHGINWK